MVGHLYRFRSTWRVGGSPDDVYAVLERLPDYPLWWPQVQRVTPLSELACELVCRSSLPYELRFTAEHAVRDPRRRVLEAKVSGDLEGFSRWTISNDSEATSATFEEHVVVTKPVLRRVELVARPAFRANHSRMMRDGERGLRAYLAGFLAGLDHRREPGLSR